jgi:Tfp pilus assembly protein PilO
VKKKLGALDVKIQIGLIVVLAVVLGFVGRMFLVNPQKDQATALQTQLDDVNTQIATRTAQAHSSAKPQPMEVADLFRLSKAIPDREDMPGIILTISQVARSAGISFDTIEPQDITPIGNYRARKLHLTFNGDFYSLSDFLYRLRSLVTVNDGKLDASGRLFTVQNMTFTLGQNQFPNIAADITLNAYMYGTGVAVAAPATTPPATGTATTETPPAETPTPEGATAAGATP